MKRIVIGVLCLVLVAALVGGAVGLVAPSPRIYSVDEVQTGLQRQPGAWAGRTILIRGWSNSASGVGCVMPRPGARGLYSLWATCKRAWLMLTPGFPAQGPETFPVLLPRTGPDLTRADLLVEAGMGLHTLPVVGPTLFRWGGSRTLRVHLTLSAGCATTRPPCPGGVLIP